MEKQQMGGADVAVDTSFIDLAEGNFNKQPTVPLSQEDRDVMYAAPTVVQKPENTDRAQEILQNIIESSPQQVPVTPGSPKVDRTEIAYQELAKHYPNIIDITKEGTLKRVIESSNSKNEFDSSEKVIYPLVAAGMVVVAANATAIPALLTGLAYGGGATTLTAGGIGVATVLGVMPLIALSAITAYGGYKLFKNIQGKMRVKKDMKNYNEAFGNPIGV